VGTLIDDKPGEAQFRGDTGYTVLISVSLNPQSYLAGWAEVQCKCVPIESNPTDK